MSLFGIYRELPFGVCSHDSQRQSPLAKGGELYRGEKEKEAGKATVNGCMDFPRLSPGPEGRGAFFFLLALPSSQGVRNFLSLCLIKGSVY